MRKTTLLIGALGALALLSACGGGRYHEAGYFGGPDVYYDGFYGPYNDGYWDGDAFFYRGGDGRYVRDEGGHFRRQSFEHAQGFHAGRRPVG